ncbi:MAG TPA: DUF3108 domain-containing protein [Geobacteraceae bacterium]
MNIYPRKTVSFPVFAILSLLLHGVAVYTLARFGRYDFTPPVIYSSTVAVELKQAEETPRGSVRGLPVAVRKITPREPAAAGYPGENAGAGHVDGAAATVMMVKPDKAEAALDIGSGGEDGNDKGINREDEAEKPSDEVVQPVTGAMSFPARKAGEFLSATRERLSYQISLLGIPVGSAVLEAAGRENEIRITMTVRSNGVISSVYPVSDFAESRLIGGMFIVNNFRQQEGTFRSDTGFTLCLPQRSVLWTDRLAGVVVSHPLEDDDVLDIISGFYFLRNRPLEVGKTLRLHIFDKQQSVDTPVEVLRRERVTLPGFREADTLVIRPGLPTDGFFRRSGDLLVWLTDDEFKVPVRMETTIPLGKVTAELVSSEVERPEKKQ